MSYGIAQIKELRTEVAGLTPMVSRNDIIAYQEKRDAVILSFLPHASNTTKMTEKSWVKKAQQANDGYLETVLYRDIWDDLLPNERLAIEHLHYENAALVSEDTRLFANLHAYISAKRGGNMILAKQQLNHALWEVLYNSLFQPRNVLERDKTKHRRNAQAIMLNSLNISMIDVHTPDYVIEPIRQRYQNTLLEELLPDIVFPLEANAREIAEEIQQITAEIQREIFGQKSIVSDSQTTPEATDAFVDLYMGIIDDGTRTLIEKELEKLAKQGRNQEEIVQAIEQSLQTHQDSTIPRKVDMLAHHFNGKLTELEQREEGYRYYIWHSQDDEKVRPDHAANDGKIFSWDNPPPTGHPGEDYNCRCYAEPYRDPPAPYDPPIESVYPEAILIPALRLRGIIAAGLKRIGKVLGKVRKTPVKPRLNDTRTWPKPSAKGKLKEGAPSRNKPRSRGEKSLYDEKGGEWRYSPGDKYHNPHWDYKPAGKSQQWQNVPIDGKPPVK